MSRSVYPSDYFLAQLASRVYNERKAELPELTEDWVSLTTASGHHDYFGAAYYNLNNQQVVISHQGTNSMGALWADLQGVLHNNYTPQMYSAITFANEIAIVLNELNQRYKVNLQLSFTGHSLGGWLAQITAFTTKYLIKKGDIFLKNKNPQEDSYHLHTVIFDSPGCQDMLLKMKDDFDVRYESSLSTSSLDVTVYLSAPNLVNTCRTHLDTSTIYRLFVADLLHSRSSWDLAQYTKETHSMDKIKGALDPNKNSNLKIKEVIDWPAIKKGIIKRAFEKLLSGPVSIVHQGLRKVVFKLSKWGKPGPLPESNEYEYFHKLAQYIEGYNPEPDDKEGYCVIRYQVRDVDKAKCSANIFTQPEFDFLHSYETLRGFSDSPVANPHTLFSSINEESIVQKIITVLKNFKIEKEKEKNSIHCESEQELQELISYVKNMLYLFPDIKNNVKSALENRDIREGFYKSYSSDYLGSISKDLNFIEGTINLNDFLKHTDLQISQQIFQIDTSVMVNAVDKAVKTIYQNEKHYIVLDLEGFLNLERLFKLVEFLKQIKDNYLLVIECKHSDNFNKEIDNNIKKFFENLFSTLENKPDIKLILITKKGDKLSNFLKNKDKKKLSNKHKIKNYSEIKFSDLTEISQEVFLRKEVLFQGKEIKLGELVDEDSKRIINAEILSKLAKNDKIEIGYDLKGLGDVEGYYIARTFNRQVKIEESLKKETSKFFITPDNKDVMTEQNPQQSQGTALIPDAGDNKIKVDKELQEFGIEGYPISRTSDRQYVTAQSNLQQSQDMVSTNPQQGQDIVLISDTGNGFNELRNKYKEFNIHWLIQKNDGLTWKQSYGALSKLREFVSTNEQSTKRYEPEKIIDINDKVVIVSAEPGMGKSTVLTKLVQETKKVGSSLWVVRIDLNDHTDNLDKANFDDNTDKAVEFLLTTLKFEDNSFQNKLFKHKLKSGGKVSLLLDGFDEISPDYKERVIQLLQVLKKTKAEKLWVTTRPHMRNELEDKLSILSYTLVPFSKEDQERFLKRFWSKSLGDSNMNEERLEIYIKELLKLIFRSIHDKEREFTGIPLQIKMLAEAFEGDFKEFYSNQDKPRLPDKLDLLDLYQRFIEKKYEILREKTGASRNNVFVGQMAQSHKEKMEKQHKYLALNMLFPEQEIASIKKNKLSDEELVSLGIISQGIDGKLNFVHRTFAEYFAAHLLVDKQKDPKVQDFVREKIFEKENEVLCNFFDRMLVHDEHGENKYEIHTAVLNNDKDKVNELLSDPQKVENAINMPDKGGRTALHLAAAYGYEEVVQSLLNKLKEETSELETSINVKDKLFGWSPLSYADKGSHWGAAELLLKKGANGDDMFEAKNNVLSVYEEGKTLLHIAAKEGYVEFAKVLLEKGAEVNVQDKDGRTPLQWAAKEGKLDVVKYLIEKGADLNVQGKDVSTSLHRAAEKGRLDIVKFLVEKGADLNVQDKDGRTSLRRAASNGNLDVVKYLIEKGADVNIPDKDVSTPLHRAAEKDRLDIVKFLVEKGADLNVQDKDGRTSLHRAASNGNLDVVKYLIEKGADVNIPDKDVSTPLHRAAEKDRLDIVKFLVEKGADLNVQDKDGRTPLHWAAYRGKLNVVTYLVEKGVDVNVLDKDGRTPLHWAAHVGRFDVVKYLVEKGADFTVHDKDGWTPLHLAVKEYELNAKYDVEEGAEKDRFDIVKFLVEKGADFKVPDKDVMTPLHLAASNGSLDVVKFLIEKGANVNAANKDSIAPLHLAAEKGNLDVVKLLVEKGADLNVQDKDGRTPLHWAAESGNLDIIKLLVEKGADLNVQDKDGGTPLHWAAESGNLDIVKLLVEKGADLNVQDKDGGTPLHWAAKEREWDVVKFLVEKGADINVPDKNGMTPLYRAIKNSRWGIVKFLVEKGADVDTADKDGNTPLHSVAEKGNLDTVKFFIEKGVSVNAINKNGMTPLHLAARYDKQNRLGSYHDRLYKWDFDYSNERDSDYDNKLHTVKLLVEKDADLNVQDKDGRTSLHWAAESGNLDIVKLLVEKGADLNVQDKDGGTPLHWAAKEREWDVVKFLVEKGADINVPDKNGMTPLYRAIKNSRWGIVKFLVEKGADVDTADKDGNTPLHSVAEKGNLDTVKFFIEKGVSVNAINKNGMTPLHLAARYDKQNRLGSYHDRLYKWDFDYSNERDSDYDNKLHTVKLLVEKDADLNVQDKDGRTSLHWAAESGNLDIVKLLVEKGADLNVQDKDGGTPLHWAAKKREWDVIKYLVEKDADLNVQDKDGRTPLHWAAESGNLDIIKLLVEKGADLNVQDKDGRTPLHWAAKKREWDVIKYLVEKGADLSVSDKNGSTPLHWDSKEGEWDVIKYLVEEGKLNILKYFDDFKVTDKWGNTPLHLAAFIGKLSTVRYLIDKAADYVYVVRGKDKGKGKAAWHYALVDEDKKEAFLAKSATGSIDVTDYGKILYSGWGQDPPKETIDKINGNLELVEYLGIIRQQSHLNIVKYLVDKGADFKAKNKCGSTPLHLAAYNGNLDTVKYLVDEKDTNLNVFDKNGDTPLHDAAYNGNLDTVKYLIDKGADFEARNKHGNTPLHSAARKGKLDIVKYLIDEKGAAFKISNKDGKTPLHFAAQNGHLDTVKYLIDEKSADFTVTDKYGNTPLHFAAQNGHLDTVKYLIDEKSADFTVTDKYGNTPLHLAAQNGHLDTVKYLIDEKNADFKTANKSGKTPLHFAARNGYKEVANALLDKVKNDPKGLNKLLFNTEEYGMTPLHYAVLNDHKEVIEAILSEMKSNLSDLQDLIFGQAGNVDEVDFNDHSLVVKLLREKSAEAFIKNKLQHTVLHEAIIGNKKEIIKLVLNKIKETKENIDQYINAKDNKGNTPLMWAADDGKINAAQILLEYGVDIDVKNNDGMTALHLAAKSGKLGVVKLLVDKGAKVDTVSSNGMTPLNKAAESGELDIVKFFVEKGADFNVPDKDGRTPLHSAAQNGNLEIVKLLLENGEDVLARSNHDTVLHLAVSSGNEEVIKLILDKIKEKLNQNPQLMYQHINAPDNEGNTPLMWATKTGRVNVAQILLRYGADINAESKDGNTALVWAVKENHLETAVILLKHGGVSTGSLSENQRDELIDYIVQHNKDEEAEPILEQLFQPENLVQAKEKQQKAYLHLSKFISNHFPNLAIESVKQGLYLPSFEERQVKINGKCAAITCAFSQGLFLSQQDKLNQQDKVLLSNLQTSAELYERLAQGKQVSLREEREIFDLSKLLDNFEQKLDSPTSSLPSSLSHVKSYKTLNDLSRYLSDILDNFAIHLVTSNHVVAIYRIGNDYAYFDSNVAFVSGLKSIHQLMKVLEKAVSFAGYELVEDGFLVEHFDATKANNALTTKQKQTLTKPIQTERHLLSLQDQRLGYINLNGKQVSRVILYDLGTKLHLEGSTPILINSDMNLSSENLLAYLSAGKISVTARNYLERLKGNSAQELVQTTKAIPFSGSRNEIKHAQQIKELLSSDIGSKLKSYELNHLLKSPIEKSIKALPYYLEVAKTKHWPDRLTNAAGRIQLIRGVHGAVVSCDRERGNTKGCLLNTGEISLSLVSQLIEDKVVQNVPKLIKSLKTAKFGAHILRGGAAIISSPFDIYDVIDSAIDLHNCEKGSNECKDAIAGVTFASTSLASGVMLTAIGAPGVGTAVGLVIMVAQGAYGGGRAIEEFQPYRLTFDENFRLFWHVFALQPVPKDIEYIKARKDIVSQIAKQVWEQLQSRSEHIVAHVTGLGDVTFKEELECKPGKNYQLCTHRRVRVPILSPSNAVISMDKDNADTSKLARIIPDLPSSEAEMICLPKWSGIETYEYREVPTSERGCHSSSCLTKYKTVPYYNQSPTAIYSCDNAMVISHKQRMDQIQVSGNKKIVFDLNLVNQGMIVGSDKWQNDFIVSKGKTKILGGENTRNTFILTSDFTDTIFGGKNSTNILDVSNLSSSNYSLYIDNLSPFDRTSYVQDYTINKRQMEGQTNEPHFYGINNVVISANTTVEGNGDKYTFYVKPSPGYSKVNVSKGSIVFPEIALLLDCNSFTYSSESNVLSMKFSNFTLDIGNYFNREQKMCNFELIDKHGSTIEPLVDLAQSNSQEVKLFNLRTETTLTYNNVTKWYENIAKASGKYQVYGTVRVKYPIAQERYGLYPNMIIGSEKSDVIPLTQETWYAEGKEGSDSYNVILSDSKNSATTEINNYAEDKSLDILYMPVNSIQASRDEDNLLLYAANSTRPVKVKDYFLGDNYQHLVVINDNKDTFIPLEGPSEDVSLVPFYHPTDSQHIFSLAAEKVANNSEIIVDAKLDDIRFYRDGNDLLLMDDKPLMVKLENFYDKHGNLTLNFWHHNHKDKLSSEQLFELAKLAINYQDEIKSTYYDNVKEYIVSASNATIHHNQKFVNGSLTTVEPSTKRVGVWALQDPSDIEVSVDNEDLVFFVTQNNATFTIKNWNDTDHRISALKFNQEIEVTGLDKFDLSQVSEIQPLINKAVLSSIATQQLEKLDSNVVNGIKYLLAVRGIENGVGTHKCLGFDSAEEEQQFISAYHFSYSSEKLSQVLHHNQASKALVWLVVKGYTDLSLENQSIDRKNDLNKCFNAVTNKRVMSRIVRKLEVGNIEEIIPNMESFIRHHKEALEDRIVNSLRSNTTEIDTEEGNHQRKRRDVRVVKDYKDYVFFNAQNNANSSLKGQQVTSGGNKLSSWINTAFGFATKGISQLGNFFSSSKVSFPTINAEHPTSQKNSTQSNNISLTPHIDLDGTILLLDVLIRKITGEKYVSSVDQSVSLLEAQASALSMTEEFGKVLSKISYAPAEELIDLVEVQSKIFKAMMSGSGKIPGILCSCVEEAKLEPEVTKKILGALEGFSLANVSTSEGQTKHLPSLPNTTYNKPQTCLSSIKVENSSVQLCRAV